MGFTKQEIKEARGIFSRIKKRDFSGNEGKAIKNSSWQIATTLIAKIGSLIFTIIIARLMLPELYGLYGLALSTILFLGVFSDLGVGAALQTYLSKTIDKTPGKAKGYFYLLTKYKIILTIISSLILLLLANWFANSFYNKQIYYALLSGAIYIPIATLSEHLGSVFTSRNDFRPQFIRETIVQVTRIITIPLAIIYFLKTMPPQTYLLSVFILLSICYALGGLYFFISLKLKHPFKKSKPEKLSKKEKKKLLWFIIPLSTTAFSGIFFGFIDQIMLGHYVQSQFLGFYQAAFNLVTSASITIAFSAAALFPIFARLSGKRLERGFRKTRNITLLVSILAAIFTFLAAPYIVQIIYGSQYATTTIYLRILSTLIISFPLINLYTTYYTSQERTKIIAVLLILSTILNAILNYVLINIGLQYSMSHAVIGACAATIISRYSYLAGLILWRRR